MKTRSLLTAALLLTVAQTVRAQTADYWVGQGRAHLAATNLAAANLCFSNAVFVSSGHQTGNVFYAVTRLLVLPNQPAGSDFLNRLGVTNAGRNIYNWTALPPKDRSGVPPPPAGVYASDFTAILRTNILTELIGAEANLAKVTDTNFVLSLSSNETRSVDVTLDYGDVKLLRAMLQAAEYASYTAYSWNLDVELEPVYDLYNINHFSLEGLLSDNPGLLTFATTNDLAAAKAALLAGVSRYCEASQLIRNRPTNIVRLFNYDPDKATGEANFRQTLVDLTNSLTHAVTLGVNSNYTVFLASQFSGTHAPRPFLPVIRGNGFGLGTLPDPTFAGLVSSSIPGIVEDSVEEFFARGLSPIPTIARGLTRAGPQFQFPINTLKNRGYTVEVSTNFLDWTTCSAFFSFADYYAFADSNAYISPRRFYRVVDSTENMPAPPNADFANRISLTGLGIVTFGYNASGTADPSDSWSSAWWSWTAPVSGTVVVAAFGGTGEPYAQVYTGTAQTNLSFVAWDSQPFYAVAGTTYQIEVGGYPGGIRLVITAPPTLTIISPQDGMAFPVPTNITISASATDSDGSVTNLAFYTDGELLGSIANASLSMTWSNVGVGSHSIGVEATDNLGMTTWSNLTVYIRPPNDNFANHIPISGSSATVAGNTAGASTEPGESAFFGNSVWWSWTAPFTGYVTISANLTYSGYWTSPLAVYTGTSVSNLLVVASDDGSADFYGDPTQVSFVATTGVAYQIAVYGAPYSSGPPCCGNYRIGEGPITLRLVPTAPPQVTILSPTDGALFTGPTNLTITADAVDSDGISRVDFYDSGYYGYYAGSVTNPPYTMVLSNLYPGSSHSLVAKATDNMGARTYSAPVGVYIEYPETPLQLDVSVPNLSGAMGSNSYYRLDVPTGLSSLTIQIYGGTGDCDLYVAYGYQPTLYDYDYRPYMHGNDEYVDIYQPTPGDWHIMLNGWNSYSGVTLEAQ